jgi:NAD(P)-dependent dehydrogenase (short-subunit alcohol dehydrogenase family)
MKVWFITGASRGFGALVTEKALAKGDAVVATARKPQQIVDRFGDHPNLLAVGLDVTDEAQAHARRQGCGRAVRTHQHTIQQRRLRPARRCRGSEPAGVRGRLGGLTSLSQKKELRS